MYDSLAQELKMQRVVSDIAAKVGVDSGLDDRTNRLVAAAEKRAENARSYADNLMMSQKLAEGRA
jgi:hypothetical protein